MMRNTSPRRLLAAGLALVVWGGAALAWTPALDLETATAIVDGAYRRTEEVPTSVRIDLAVRDGAFAAGPGVVSVFDGGPACLANWLQAPANYAAHGSRPTSVTVAGQGDFAQLAARTARNEFRSLSPEEALRIAREGLPNAHLRVFLAISGLAQERLRDAYLVAVQDRAGRLFQPYRIGFLPDWQARGEPARWAGTMVYFFDLGTADIDTNGALPLLVRTEARSDCAYRINVDLGAFQ
jgi:hypothetical protein